jgi:superfamily I DNA/RNA helicase
VEGRIPFYRNVTGELLMEERRLFYIAIIRARDSLSIMRPGEVLTPWGSRKVARASQFLNTILKNPAPWRTNRMDARKR